MKTRIYIAILFLSFSFFLIALSLKSNPNISLVDIYLNLGTELIGIVLTILIVDWLLERKRAREEMKKIALNGLSKINYAVWIWQGCPRDLNISILYSFLSETSNNDKLSVSTQNLIIQLANTSEETITLNPEAVNSNKILNQALKELSSLAKMRDTNNVLSPKSIANCLASVILKFADVLKIKNIFKDKQDNNHTLIRDTASEKQNWRRFGQHEE